jgi:hypothetical protein
MIIESWVWDVCCAIFCCWISQDITRYVGDMSQSFGKTLSRLVAEHEAQQSLNCRPLSFHFLNCECNMNNTLVLVRYSARSWDTFLLHRLDAAQYFWNIHTEPWSQLTVHTSDKCSPLHVSYLGVPRHDVKQFDRRHHHEVNCQNPTKHHNGFLYEARWDDTCQTLHKVPQSTRVERPERRLPLVHVRLGGVYGRRQSMHYAGPNNVYFSDTDSSSMIELKSCKGVSVVAKTRLKSGVLDQISYSCLLFLAKHFHSRDRTLSRFRVTCHSGLDWIWEL